MGPVSAETFLVVSLLELAGVGIWAWIGYRWGRAAGRREAKAYFLRRARDKVQESQQARNMTSAMRAHIESRKAAGQGGQKPPGVA
jgi:hypothetical protein